MIDVYLLTKEFNKWFALHGRALVPTACEKFIHNIAWYLSQREMENKRGILCLSLVHHAVCRYTRKPLNRWRNWTQSSLWKTCSHHIMLEFPLPSFSVLHLSSSLPQIFASQYYWRFWFKCTGFLANLQIFFHCVNVGLLDITLLIHAWIMAWYWCHWKCFFRTRL